MTCVARGEATAGQYKNVGSVVAKTQDYTYVDDSDPSHYFGEGEPRIEIEKSTNEEDADEPPGPILAIGDPVKWTYQIRNTGEVTLYHVVVADDRIGSVSCPKSTLEPGDSMTCYVHGEATAGQYKNVGSVVAKTADGTYVDDSDPSHYFGEGEPRIQIEKSTNGHDADEPPGPVLTVGDPVEWTYEVSNIGDVPLYHVTVTDDPIGAVTCPKSILEPGATMVCEKRGEVVAGQYKNVGSVFAKTGEGIIVDDSDPSHYLGESDS